MTFRRTGVNVSGGAKSLWAGAYSGLLLAVYSFDGLLPTPDEASNAVVILRARDQRITSLTGLDWLEKYSARMQAAGGKLMPSGVEDDLMETLAKAEAVERLGAESIFRTEPRLFASTEKALEAAKSWIEDLTQRN